MHSCEPVPAAPPVTGPALLLQLGRLIIRGRSRSPARSGRATRTAPDTSRALHERLLQAKLLAAKAGVAKPTDLPSTSKETPPRHSEPTEDRTKPHVEAQLNDHVQALWNEQIPICIEVLLAPDCKDCYSRLSRVDEEAAYDKTHSHDHRIMLLERWTMSVFLKKNHETPTFITTQWLLNAVRSQLHFSQLSAWFARLKNTIQTKTDVETNPEERRRKLSREMCNIKKLEANCDEEELPKAGAAKEELPKPQRRLNIVYSIKIPGESYKTAEFSRPPTDHIFPITDIGNNVYLKVVLQSLPRVDDIPTVMCSCPQPGLKRRTSKEMTPLSLSEELALRIDDLNLGPVDTRLSVEDRFRCKGAMFSPDLGVINSNIGSSSGVTRRLSIFSNPGSTEYLYSRASTPERQPDSDAGSQDGKGNASVQGSPSKEMCHKRSLQLDRPHVTIGPNESRDNIVRANYLLLDDRMHTPCSESGKHKCNCDDESDQGKQDNPRSSTSIRVKREAGPNEARTEPKKQLDERRLKEIAKYKRRLRKESKLRKLRDSGGTSESAGASESGEGVPDNHSISRRGSKSTILKEEHHTSIPILQASRFDRLRAIGCYRNQTYLTLPASRAESKSPFVADSGSSIPPTEFKKSISVSTQTEEPLCSCGSRIDWKCSDCTKQRGMVRSAGNYNLASVNQSEVLLDAIRRSCQSRGSRSESPTSSEVEGTARRKTRDDVNEDDEKAMKKHKCDNNSSNSIKCDIIRDNLDNNSFSSVSDSREVDCSDDVDMPLTPGIRKCPDDDGTPEECTSIIKRPKLRRFCPIVDRIEKIVSDRFSQKDTNISKDNTKSPSDEANNDIEELLLKDDDSVFSYMALSNSTNHDSLEETCPIRRKNTSISDDDYIIYEKCDYGTFDSHDTESPNESVDDLNLLNPDSSFKFPDVKKNGNADNQVPSPTEVDRFRWRFDSAASMVFSTGTGLPLTSSPAPLRRGNNSFDYDSSITGVSSIKSALFHPVSPPEGWRSPGSSPGSPARTSPRPAPPAPRADIPLRRTEIKSGLRVKPSTGLLGSFEESALKGRMEPVATVHGFTAELGASGAFCPPHRRLPVTVFFYAPGGTNAPYMGHINLGSGGYRVARSGTIQVSLFNPHGTLVKMFVVLYDLTAMPAAARTFLRQRTLYMPVGVTEPPPPRACYRWLRYLIHLRFLTSKSGKLYLHTDIRIIVSRKADMDTATAHSVVHRNIQSKDEELESSRKYESSRRMEACREENYFELGVDSLNGIPYELRSFTYAPDNPKYSPR